MRRLRESIEDRNQYILYYKGVIQRQRGVGFLIKASLKNQIKEFRGISDRIAYVNMTLPGYSKDWVIIQIYAPTEQANPCDLDQFYQALSETIIKVKNNHIVVMGDFNAQVGVRSSGEENVLGRFGHGKRSKNGQKMIDFVLEPI
ncbi:unnamed protein product [Parnassius apollo]|uniref:(apollo) hypothetical protein n=1 Tax=Parnassius apollo TaxID=110799 RepID=A0A8S3XI27_PARAO|nr:unnamed protein product [Parnassius apollo]